MTWLLLCLICGVISSYIAAAITRYSMSPVTHLIAGALAGLVCWAILRVVIR